MIDPPKGDAFACRNEYALNIDYEEMPPMFKITDTHYAATWLLDPRAPKAEMPPELKERIARRSNHLWEEQRMSKEVLLDVRHLTQQFHLTKKIKVKAVDDVSFQIHKGEIFGLVGESGSGKSTVARCLMNIYQPAQGEIWYKDVNICDKKEFKKQKCCRPAAR